MSEPLKLNKRDGIKIVKGLGIALAGTALTYLAEVLPGINFGKWTPVIVAVNSVVVNVVRKLITKTDEE